MIPDRLVSLADPDARPIRKGKLGRPNEFGYTCRLAEDERGFVADHDLSKGNLPDAPRLVPAVMRAAAHLANRGRGPHQPPQTRLRAGPNPAAQPGRAQTWVGLGVFAYNLQRMTVIA